MEKDYNNTLNLPQSDFPMRGNLHLREPDFLKHWEEQDRYNQLMKKNEGKPLYILHDGPPYANGDIHLGTSLNKVLKDIVVKYKNMSGFKAPFVPGWDTHGLPIELKALKKDGVDPSNIDKVSLRKICREFALSYVENQKGQFKRLGVLADFDNPYLTLNREFEAKQIEVFGEMAKKKFIYKGLKPVYWCAECQTALAEAEIEYADDPCYSIFVKFNVIDDNGIFSKLGIEKEDVFFVIWTTTTWTLPGNVAICLGPEYEYTLVKVNSEYLVIAKELVEPTMKSVNIDSYETIGSFKGKELENIKTQHPFLDKQSLVIYGDHVTLESGTGCVHTAPGHGVEDFEVCKKYDDLQIVVPVDANGFLTDLAGEFSGLKIYDANKAIAKKLEENNRLLATEKINHQYPHCWRCQNPVIFRATEQWFCSIEPFKDKAIAELSNIDWIPAWGEKRIEGMIRDRSDWCISRQRTWGVPIPIIYCSDCNKPIINDTTIKAISELFKNEGSDAWFYKEASEFIPSSVKCDCGCGSFIKETDIMDVWFDSGVSHVAVLDQRDDLHWPADLYLEGGDQYRGWFQSSLLTSVAFKGSAPFKSICTHGWVVDGDGRKQSKSLGNGIAPQEIVKQYGADILRLWVASSDYHADIRISKEILKQLTESYRKIRNTSKYILGNLYDFNPDLDMVDSCDFDEFDKIAIHKFSNLINKVNNAYENLEFHVVYHAIHNFCVVDMSSFYLDIIKDRLYCEEKTSKKRRSTQTVIYIILDGMTRMLAPILSYTSEEIWSFMNHKSCDDGESILFNQMYKSLETKETKHFIEKWDIFLSLRDDTLKALEIKRADGIIGKSLEADVTIYASGNTYDLLYSMKDILPELFIVSNVFIENNGTGEFTGENKDVSVTITKSTHEKCERCWVYSDTVGKHGVHTTLCHRCVKTLT